MGCWEGVACCSLSADARTAPHLFLSARAQACAPLGSDEEKASLIDSTKVFVFDCDGVIWKGDSVIDGVPEVRKRARAAPPHHTRARARARTYAQACLPPSLSPSLPCAGDPAAVR